MTAWRWVRRWGPRGIALALTGTGLYVVAPSLLAMLGAWPQLETVRPGWFVLLAALEAGSFASLWVLTHVALSQPRHARRTGEPAAPARMTPAHAGPRRRRARSLRWTDVAGAQLVGNAASRVLPVPAVLIGPPPAHQLQLGLLVSLVVAVVVVGLGVLALTVPRMVVFLGFAVGGLLHLARVPVTAVGVAMGVARQRARVKAAFLGHWWRAVMAASAHRMLDYAALVAALVAVGAQVRPSLVLLAYVVAMVIGMVPVTPGGLGFVETGLTGALVLAGVTADAALLATLLYRLVSFWMPIPAGALAWAGLAVNRSGAARQASARQGDAGAHVA